jgi:hypothetical protein
MKGAVDPEDKELILAGLNVARRLYSRIAEKKKVWSEEPGEQFPAKLFVSDLQELSHPCQNTQSPVN